MATTSARLSGKVAIVTGAAKGIGYACARALASNGARVMLADVDLARAEQSAREIETATGQKAAAVKCDVRIKAECESMVDSTVGQFGGVDILVANAGIVKAAPFLEMTEEDFDDVIAVNLKGAFLCCQAAGNQMVKQVQEGDKKTKSIITMSSVNAIFAIPTIAGYNASKGGMNGLTRCMSLALAPHGIRVNGIGPGSIATDVLASVATDEEAKKRILSRTPMGRIGEPDEIASVATFLASDDSSYMSGQILYVDGGRMALNVRGHCQALLGNRHSS